ncbi:MAG: hypothetical protein KJ886_03075 [Candidatus Thermoplasmatota archaeon]|nr:hypothetical protein [Candidatus Thermoplasmatota archaeon]MBU4256453.1 hypothetical protein [Candidatus Thermoplasmatota archaeon]MCG2735688.1 hypothetical protein [Candidatus Methanoperedenaceae archaeon]MCG2825251.1 hypothetical protein [Thermoplasmatales archaeon]
MKEKEKLTKNRLILIKALYEHGKKHANNGTCLDRMIATHNFDNAIEFLLKSIAVKFEISIKKRNKYLNFYDLWKVITEKTSLPYAEDIFALHDLRNQVQHHSTIPSSESISRFVSCTKEFLVKILKEFFEIEYDKLYLSLLIENEGLQEKVMKIERVFESGDYKKCVNLCLGVLTDVTWGTKSIEGIAFSAGRLTSFFGAEKELKNITTKEYIKKTYPNNKLAKEVGKALSQLGQSSTCMQFLTLPQKTLFLKLFDTIIKQKISKKDAQDSINFVVDVILNWEEIGLIKTNKNPQVIQDANTN